MQHKQIKRAVNTLYGIVATNTEGAEKIKAKINVAHPTVSDEMRIAFIEHLNATSTTLLDVIKILTHENS